MGRRTSRIDYPRGYLHRFQRFSSCDWIKTFLREIVCSEYTLKLNKVLVAHPLICKGRVYLLPFFSDKHESVQKRIYSCAIPFFSKYLLFLGYKLLPFISLMSCLCSIFVAVLYSRLYFYFCPFFFLLIYLYTFSRNFRRFVCLVFIICK